VKLIRPMLATLSTAIPTGPGWVFEEKYDGIRALAYRTNKKVRLWSRNALDLTAGFPDIASAVAALPGGDLVLDGELVIFDAKGVSRFQLLQRRGAGGRSEYAVFDLLEQDGVSLLKRPLNERRAALEALVDRRPALRLSRRMGKSGAPAYATARKKGWEGIIAKAETSQAVRLVTRVGSRLPAFAAASGRVLVTVNDSAGIDVAQLRELFSRGVATPSSLSVHLLHPHAERLAGELSASF